MSAGLALQRHAQYSACKPSEIAMYCLSVHVLPDYVAQFNQPLFLQTVKSVGRTPEIDRFQEKHGPVLQYHFFTEKPVPVWQALDRALFGDDALTREFAEQIAISYEPRRNGLR